MTGYHYVVKLLRSLEGEAGVENHSFRRFFSIVERGSSETEILKYKNFFNFSFTDMKMFLLVPQNDF